MLQALIASLSGDGAVDFRQSRNDAGNRQQVENGPFLPCPNTSVGKPCSEHCHVDMGKPQSETLTLDKFRKGMP